jgi:hypothetical protein
MDNQRLSTVLRTFIKHVSEGADQSDRPMRVIDLRLAIRNARLSEITEWSSHHLDGIEVHAARFADDAPLEIILESQSLEAQDSTLAVSSICSPSPFAWT